MAPVLRGIIVNFFLLARIASSHLLQSYTDLNFNSNEQLSLWRYFQLYHELLNYTTKDYITSTMETQFFYDIASWPMDNLVDLQMGAYDEVGLVPFIASDFPSTAEIGLNYSWSREQPNWTNEYSIKSDASQPYPQSWYEAGLVRQDHEWMNDNPTR